MSGVAVVGMHGAGKSLFASALVDTLGAGFHTVHLHANLLGVPLDYGPLGFLLARLPGDSTDSPTAVLHAMARLIQEDAAGKSAVLVVDDASALDHFSVGVLVHLVATGTAKVVLVTSSVRSLAPEFLRRLREGRFATITLQNPGVERAGAMLRSLLGSSVSASAVSALHAASGGNPVYLRALAEDQRAAGNLVCTGGIWMLREAALDRSALDDLLRVRLNRESPEAQDVIELLAVGRHVPLHELVVLSRADVVAELEDNGTVQVENGARGCASLADPLFADAVRGWIPVHRRRALSARLSRPDGDGTVPPSGRQLVDYALRTLDCRLPLRPALALAAGHAAASMPLPEAVLSCVEAIRRDDGEWFTGQLLKAEACLLLERPDEARAHLDEIPATLVEQAETDDLVRYVADRCEIDHAVESPPRSPADCLARARGLVAERDRPGEVEAAATRRAAARLEVLAFAERCFQGDYQAVLGPLEDALASGRLAEEDLRYQCGALLVGARSVCGRELDALDLAARLTAEAGFRHTGPHSRHALVSQYYFALLLAGRWRACLDLVQQAWEGKLARLARSGGAAETYTGLALVYAGQGARALEHLQSAVAQLEGRPARTRLATAYAATAFAYAQTGEASQAYKYLELLAGTPRPRQWQMMSITMFCEAMALRWLGDASGRTLLWAAAQEDLGHGRVTTAGISLLGMSIPGNDEEFRLLEEVAARRQGPLAELSRTIAEGSRTRRPRRLLEAAEMARSMELEAVEARCAALAVDFAREAGDAVSGKAAQARLDRLTASIPRLPVTPSVSAPVLSERERQVALLASNGVPNKEIAARLGLSVRTVEGHLYQVFTKLGVTSRSSLAGLV
ncbi:helix-turn-helix transcriptional regulator [Paenarthrobacter sp. DKR-5]|uniref:LuxR family transcriptional regulator n=1 Tax=Paenarthrobacter sp. DKR-5 TaxID=2835535 RepID=UPI001BDC901E|nr:LuxR family transcriptional regulator [Paenarthrobacter sp. DKR-5]MBT1002457.1 helix-turn-helix transcriptional regulator [Paenarthrobacter sp. DKR-5]